jgi:uncharacterized protein with ATP-grasp and redox domains
VLSSDIRTISPNSRRKLS